jgi:hypothetical protein
MDGHVKPYLSVNSIDCEDEEFPSAVRVMYSSLCPTSIDVTSITYMDITISHIILLLRTSAIKMRHIGIEFGHIRIPYDLHGDVNSSSLGLYITVLVHKLAYEVFIQVILLVSDYRALVHDFSELSTKWTSSKCLLNESPNPL